jgi:hypothetical protein
MFHVCVGWKFCNLEIIHKARDMKVCCVEFGGPCANIWWGGVDSIPRVVSMCVCLVSDMMKARAENFMKCLKKREYLHAFLTACDTTP